MPRKKINNYKPPELSDAYHKTEKDELVARLDNYQYEDSINRQKTDKEISDLLANEGLNELLKNTDPANPKTAREKFVRYLVDVLHDANSDTPPRAKDKYGATDITSLLGTEGLNLYKAAIEEESQSAAFRRAVFTASHEHRKGLTWNKRLLLWIAGPSGAGKSFARDKILAEIEEKNKLAPEPGVEKGNHIITIDGGIQRAESQIRSLLLDTALQKGYSGIRDLEHNTKLKTKKYIKNAALTALEDKNRKINLVMPKTFSKFVNIYHNIIGIAEKHENIDSYFSEVVGGKDAEAFQTTTLQQGNTRAFQSTHGVPKPASEKTLSLNKKPKPPCESKKYNPGGFRYGKLGSSIARAKHEKEYGSDHSISLINDLRFAIKENNDWVVCTNANPPENYLKVSQRDFDNWKYQKKNGTTTDDLRDWLKTNSNQKAQITFGASGKAVQQEPIKNKPRQTEFEDLIKKIDEADDTSSNDVSDSASRTLYQAFTAKMKQVELAKYPSTYKATYKKITYDDKSYTVCEVSYHNEKPTIKELHESIEHSLTLRKLSMVNTVAYFIDQNLIKDFLPNANIETLNACLLKYYHVAQKASDPRNSKKELETFIESFSAELSQVASMPQDEIIQRLQYGERYFVSDYHKNHITYHKTKRDEGTLLQLDVPITTLTLEQKTEYHRIHSEHPPIWFHTLPHWEQAWFKKSIPSNLEDVAGWQQFESLKLSANMQHIPSAKNARRHYFGVKSEGTARLLSSNLKTASYVPYEILESERENATAFVANQITELTNPNKDHFVYINNLLSTHIFEPKEASLSNTQQRAIEKSTQQDHIMIEGRTYNLGRMTAPETGLLAGSDWVKVSKIIERAETYKNNNPDANQHLIQSLIQALIELKKLTFAPLGRNIQAYKAAYLSMLVEEMGGTVVTNCKSGKDRTQFDEIYQDSMRLYFERYDSIPRITDHDQTRDRFVEMFETLFYSMKTQESASTNAPGAFGLKNESLVLDFDIAKELEPYHDISNKLAQTNKPGPFKAGEKQLSARMSNKSIKKAGRFFDEHKDKVELYLQHAIKRADWARITLSPDLNELNQLNNEVNAIKDGLTLQPGHHQELLSLANDASTSLTNAIHSASALPDKKIAMTPTKSVSLYTGNNREEALQRIHTPSAAVSSDAPVQEKSLSDSPISVYQKIYGDENASDGESCIAKPVTLREASTTGERKSHFYLSNDDIQAFNQEELISSKSILGTTYIPGKMATAWAIDNMDAFIATLENKDTIHITPGYLPTSCVQALILYCRYLNHPYTAPKYLDEMIKHKHEALFQLKAVELGLISPDIEPLLKKKNIFR